MPKGKEKKKPNIFEQRRRAIDQASGWEDQPAKKKAPPKQPTAGPSKASKKKSK